jgi:NTE family protein
MTSAVNIMQDRITRSRLAIDPADLVLRPDLAGFQVMDFHRAREAIDVGRAYLEQEAALLEPVVEQLRARG